MPTTLPTRYHVPTAVEPESIASRTETLMRTGNDRLASEYIAKQAAEQQALRDANVRQEIEIKTRALVGTVAETKLVGAAVPAANPPAQVAVPVTAPVFADLTIEQLRAHAAEHALRYDPTLTKKADLVTAISAAHAAKYPIA